MQVNQVNHRYNGWRESVKLVTPIKGTAIEVATIKGPSEVCQSNINIDSEAYLTTLQSYEKVLYLVMNYIQYMRDFWE